MPTTVAVSNLTASTALASGDSIPFLDVSDTTQSPGGSVVRILVSNFFGATTRVPVGFFQGLGTVTVSTPALDSTATWNDSGVTFTHIKANVTSTASAAASKLLDLQLASSSVFAVTKAGAVSFASDLAINTNKFNVTASSGNTAIAGTLAVTGIVSLAAKIVLGGADTTNAGTTDIVLPNTGGLRAAVALNNTSIALIGFNSSNVVVLGADAASSGRGHVMIPYVSTANLPAAGANLNGIILVESSTNRLVYYSGNAKYYLAGTSF